MKLKKDRSLGYFHAEAAAASVENAGIAYQSPSLIAAGAGAKDVALFSTLTNLVFSLLLVKTPVVLGKIGSTKKAVVILAFSTVLTWLPIILALTFLKSVTPALLIALWVVNLIPSILEGPLRDNWLADLVPASSTGKYFGIRSAISAALYLVTFFVMGYVLDYVPDFKGFAVVLSIAFVASVLSGLLYLAIDTSWSDGAVQKMKFGFFDFLKETRRGSLGTFIVYIFVLTLAVNLSSPFFVVYMLKDLHFSYLTYTVLVSSEYVARILCLTFCGRYADKVGHLKVIGLVSFLVPVVPLLWLLSPSVPYLIGVQFFSGAVWAAFDLCSQTFIYRAAPQAKRLRYIVYQRSLVTLSLALGALGGGFLLNFVIPIHGNAILGLFLVSGLLRLAVACCMFPRLKDTTGSVVMPQEHSDVYIEVTRDTPSRKGLLYDPSRWPVALSAASSTVQGSSSRPPRKALLRRPEDWPDFPSHAACQPVNQQGTSKPGTPLNTPLHHSERRLSPAAPASESTSQLPVKQNCPPALLHCPEQWPDSVSLSATARKSAVPMTLPHLKMLPTYEPLDRRLTDTASLAGFKKVRPAVRA